MSALYIMRYLGQSGIGFGSIYVGKGVIVGVDAANGRYHGTYTEAGERVKIKAELSAPPGGAQLVTGDQLPEGQAVPLTADWPADFADGSAREIMVMGRTVQVTFERVGDVP
ncbi:MAG: hypothetical protein ISR44_08255 [Rhodospirillales bacterium]|nr:hypothetical protein [Rhodospirillales bacterium]